MSLVNLCLDTIGRVLKKPSNVYQLRGILPDSLLQDLSVFIYSHLDPRTTMDYFAMHREYTDDIAESGIESLLNHNFSLYNNPFSADITSNFLKRISSVLGWQIKRIFSHD